jgi:hypothetical protein
LALLIGAFSVKLLKISKILMLLNQGLFKKGEYCRLVGDKMSGSFLADSIKQSVLYRNSKV